MNSTPARHPEREQLVTVDDLREALRAAERPECLHASDVLDCFIAQERAAMTHQLLGAGVPATLALRISGRMARTARASALAVVTAYWRELLPATPPTPSRTG
ncbi:MAG: hypothetical protein IT435_04390 [Phycisphaerales bacterium]|nr:hypothetical protein [Phycisphaerales bacterium]